MTLAQDNTITNLRQFFAQYTSPIFPDLGKITVEDIQTDPQGRRLFVILSKNFAGGPVTPVVVENLYTEVKRRLPANFSNYQLTICAGETPIELLVPTYMMNKPDTSRVYRRELHQKENAWVTPLDLPYSIKKGLQGRHLGICQSHGKYFNFDRQTAGSLVYANKAKAAEFEVIKQNDIKQVVAISDIHAGSRQDAQDTYDISGRRINVTEQTRGIVITAGTKRAI